eukprot:GHVU01226105.1.p1 GENE.GHVU01226105.1~~GHVU01226105.1.p1  ORF type:complete len:174 (-),score=28.96 GHVU01226105.1:457-978(-)
MPVFNEIAPGQLSPPECLAPEEQLLSAVDVELLEELTDFLEEEVAEEETGNRNNVEDVPSLEFPLGQDGISSPVWLAFGVSGKGVQCVLCGLWCAKQYSRMREHMQLCHGFNFEHVPCMRGDRPAQKQKKGRYQVAGFAKFVRLIVDFCVETGVSFHAAIFALIQTHSHLLES